MASRRIIPKEHVNYSVKRWDDGSDRRAAVVKDMTPYAKGMLHLFRLARGNTFVTEVETCLGFEVQMLERSTAAEFSGICPKLKLVKMVDMRDAMHFSLIANALPFSDKFPRPDFTVSQISPIRWATFDRATRVMKRSSNETLTSLFDVESTHIAAICGTIESICSKDTSDQQRALEVDLLYKFLLSNNNYNRLYWLADDRHVFVDSKNASDASDAKANAGSAAAPAVSAAKAKSRDDFVTCPVAKIDEKYAKQVHDEYLKRDESKDAMEQYYSTVRQIYSPPEYLRYSTAFAQAIKTSPHVLHSSITPRLGYVVAALMCLPPDSPHNLETLQKEILTAILTLAVQRIGPLPLEITKFSTREELVAFLHEKVTVVNSLLRFWAVYMTICRMFASRQYTTHEHADDFRKRVLFAWNQLRECGSNLTCCQILAPNFATTFTNESLAEFMLKVSKLKPTDKHFQMANFQDPGDKKNAYPELDRQIETNRLEAMRFIEMEKKIREEASSAAAAAAAASVAAASASKENDLKDSKDMKDVKSGSKKAEALAEHAEAEAFFIKHNPGNNFLSLIKVLGALASDPTKDQTRLLDKLYHYLRSSKGHVYPSGVMTAKFFLRTMAHAGCPEVVEYFSQFMGRHALLDSEKYPPRKGSLGHYLRLRGCVSKIDKTSLSAMVTPAPTSKTSHYGSGGGGSAGSAAADVDDNDNETVDGDDVVCKMISFESAFQKLRELRMGLGINECMVCLENKNLFPLHGDKRHTLCAACLSAVKAKDSLCPLCRQKI